MNQPLAETIFWIAALACAVAEIAIVRSIVAQRRAQHSNLVPSGSPITELIWGVVPAIALAFLLFATWHRVQQRGQHMQMNHGGHEMTAGSGKREGASQLKMVALRRVGYAALVIGFAQVVFGAIVRITGSGLGCGDHWPDCYGSFTPSSNAQSLLVEISHRYGAATLSLAIIVLALIGLRQRKADGVAGPGGALRPALLAVLLVIAAALFGAVTVKMELNALVVVTHLAIAMSLLAVLVVVVVRTGGFGATTIPARYERTFRSARAAVGLTFLALVFGALTANTPGAPAACLGFPWCRVAVGSGMPFWIQVTHRIIAFLLLGHLTGIFFASRRRGEPPVIRRATIAALGVVVLQLLVAAAMVEMNLPPAFRSLHQAVGTLLWITVVTLTALAAGNHGQTEIERIVYESPSRGEFATPEGVST